MTRGALRTRALGFALGLACLAAPARAGITVAITAPPSVTPGSTFDLQLQVTAAGSAFNAFDAIVEFDPAVLTPVPLSPLSLQQGTLMTAACGTLFHRFRTGTGRDTISLSLLCNGVTVTGPGQIYRLRFVASSTPQVTQVRFATTPRFYDAGILVTPVTAQNLNLGIGVTVGVGQELGAAAAFRIRAVPNPAHGIARFSVHAPAGGLGSVEVCDLAGRRVRGIGGVELGAGERTIEWDGRSDGGVRQPAGLYFVRLRSGSRETRTMLVLAP